MTQHQPKYVEDRFKTQPFPAIAAGKTGEPETLYAGGVKAAGAIVFSDQPAVDSTITINGTAFTFKANGAVGNQINISAVNLEGTIDNIVTALNASVVAGVASATYSKTNATTLGISFDAYDADGNLFTLAAVAGSNGTVSGATLTGGQDMGVVSVETEPSKISLSQGVNQALTLENGDEAQRKVIYMVAKSGAGNAVLTPANLAGGTTITFDTVGDYAEMRFMNGEWYVTAGTATVA